MERRPEIGRRDSVYSERRVIEHALFISRPFQQGTGTNPEELLAAAHAGCFTMALSLMLQNEGLKADSLETTCTVTLDKEGDGFAIKRSRLELRAQIPNSPGSFHTRDQRGERRVSSLEALRYGNYPGRKARELGADSRCVAGGSPARYSADIHRRMAKKTTIAKTAATRIADFHFIGVCGLLRAMLDGPLRIGGNSIRKVESSTRLVPLP